MDGKLLSVLTRIADALEGGKSQYPAADKLFSDAKTDPVEFVMNFWGESRESAEAIVKAAGSPRPEDEDVPWRSKHH